MTNSVSKKILTVAALLGAFASSGANALECGTATTAGNELIVGQTECISGNGLYFYIDIEANNTALEIQTSGGTGEADIIVNASGWATDTSYTQRTNNAGTEEKITVIAHAGRLYVSVFGQHQQVTLNVRDKKDTGGGTAPLLCGADTTSGYVLTLEQQECISGNGKYFYLDVEADNTPLVITTKNGTGEADIFVNTNGWATRSSYTASSTNAGTEESLSLTANAGRLYISVFGANDQVSFKVSAQADPTVPTNPDIPTLPANPGMCGADTIVANELTFNQIECVTIASSSSYYIYVPADNMNVTVSTGGGSGELTIYAKKDIWASSTNYDHVSSKTANGQSVTLTANKGWLYVELDAGTTGASQVSFLVAVDLSTLPTTGGGSTIPDDGFPTDKTRFIGLNGQALVERIALTHPQNVSPIFNISGSEATQIYSEANMLAIANAIITRAPSYTGEDTSGLESLFYFFRGAFYVQFSYPNDIPDYSVAVKSTIKTALRAFFNNSNAWVASEANGSVLKEALITVDSSSLGAAFNDITVRVLNQYNTQWETSFNMNAAANSVFTTIWRSLWDVELRALYATDHTILTALNNFQASKRHLIGTDEEYIVTNAARELSRLYHIPEMKSQVKVIVKSIIDSTSKNDQTIGLWLAAAGMADFYDRADCGYYNICGFAFKLEQETLTFNYKCPSGSLKIRAQSVFNDQGAWMCDILSQQETNFHQTLATLNIPVLEDNNTDLELVVFNSSAEYKTYAGQFFNMDTNNGGMYLEGSPAEEKNQARFIAYEAEWKQPKFHVWNLQHEYVHYLDGRYNLFGDFGRAISQNTIWWIEGLAEYISYREGYVHAIEVGKTQEFALSEIFKNDYNSGQARIYRWGYLAVRFMFENHRADVDQILYLLRNNKYVEYQTFMNNIGTRYDTEWNTWLISDISTVDNGIVEFGPSDETAANSGTAGNWAGEPITISTDFSPCTPNDPANAHDPANNTIVPNVLIECVNSNNGGASFIFANHNGESGTIEINTSGGWGNADIMFSSQSWATAQNNEGIANANGNYDSLRVQLNPAKLWHYITLKGEFGGVRVTINKL
ncbi:collagenase [Colwellia sp. TT2012]|uniref:collagenase n=1 Tax=Colwellia sp. TT2012 TaxID=1720342 RepID=UPI00070B6D80|nr:collagenase [Colwellia sp. TT2012]